MELTRSFVENQDGTFDVYVPKNIDTSGAGPDCSGLPTLKPLELQTYMIIGMCYLSFMVKFFELIVYLPRTKPHGCGC